MAVTRTYTADEAFDLGLDVPFELIDGELRILPGSGSRSSGISLRIGGRLDAFLLEHPIGFATSEDGGYTLGDSRGTLIAPDVGFVRFEHVPEAPDRFCSTYPDFAVEVRSPSNRFSDDEAKVQRYLAAGTSLVWLVDPKSETVTVYRSSQAPRRYTSGQTLTGEDIVPGFEISVDLIFQRPGRQTRRPR